MIKLEIKIVQDKTAPLDLAFCASAEDGDGISFGYGPNPYEALHELINEFEEEEVWRPD